MKVLFKLVIAIIIPLIINTSIQLDLISDYYNNFIAADIGESKTQMRLVPDLITQQSWFVPISHNQFSSRSNIINTDNQIRFQYLNQSYSSIIIKDKINIQPLNDSTIANFPMNLIEDRAIFFKQYSTGGIGLSFIFNDLNYSLIHQLYYKGFISHLSFSISKAKRSFVFGRIPNDFTANMTHSYCDVLPNDIYWNCAITNVNFKYKDKEVQYAKPSYVVFTTNNLHNYAPKDFIDVIVDEIFKEDIDNHNCTFGNSIDYRFLFCPITQVNKKGNFTFTIGDFEYTVDLFYFWNCPDYNCYFKFTDNLYGNYWVFGSDFYMRYNIHFDYEKAKVNLYSSNGVKRVTDERWDGGVVEGNKVMSVIIVINICWLLMGMGVVIIMKKKALKYEVK